MTTRYQKRANEKATVGEAQQLAQAFARPAVLLGRFAVFVSVVAVIVSCLALAVAINK